MRAIERLDGIPVRWLPGNHDAAFDGRRPTRESLAHYRARFGDDRYAFDEGGVRFVALNTSVAQHPDALPDEWAAQLDFLRDALESRPPGMAAILLGHHPLFVSEPDEPDSYWTIPAAPRRAILDLVHRHDVLAAFAGHLHRNALARDRGFEMVTTGPVGFPLGEDPSGVRIVEVRDGQLTHRYEALPVDGPPEPANRA
jgi:3',5'-cyclic AMP phosphodiesterase CpdA